MARGVILHLSRDIAVARALSQIACIPKPPPGAPDDAGGRPIHYRLSGPDGGFNGGSDPTAPHCADWSYGDRTPTADCIGLALWSSGIDRKQPGYKGRNKEWLNCKSLLADARTDTKFCRFLVSRETALPGDWLLTEGHIGLIIRPGVTTKHLVVDCSPRHGRETAVDTGYAWSTSCRVVRPRFYQAAA